MFSFVSFGFVSFGFVSSFVFFGFVFFGFVICVSSASVGYIEQVSLEMQNTARQAGLGDLESEQYDR